MSEEEYESPYCEVCGTCGYLGCCGIRNFIEEHIKGKTNCKNEEIIINELIDLVEYEEDKDIKIERLNSIINRIEEDKKIEKITLNDNGTIGFPNGQWTARNMDKAFAIKINKIIDKINEMEYATRYLLGEKVEEVVKETEKLLK